MSFFVLDPYELVFQITPGADGDVYDAWKSGGPYTTNSDENCQTLGPNPSCKRHFRSSVLDRWSAEAKSMVRFNNAITPMRILNCFLQGDFGVYLQF
ncbi:hypothetical protein CHS0354_003850 [Potamilus streckersoni]|uniref:Uncharacterized protein n=1 Tax=Potamilus streckersoni TaxID=2493646 RepID=A0AAE0SFY9_9BIVA|nr:hypothetical protein CHS0354_003850 [Potamilus streckersoni]